MHTYIHLLTSPKICEHVPIPNFISTIKLKSVLSSQGIKFLGLILAVMFLSGQPRDTAFYLSQLYIRIRLCCVELNY
jgi:hypothetical protein